VSHFLQALRHNQENGKKNGDGLVVFAKNKLGLEGK
jgi:hypothetical protein